MKKISNYVLPEHSNQLFKMEALSSVATQRECALKINELVEAYNAAFTGHLAKDQEQDGRIRAAILFMKDNLLNSLHELFELYMENGYFINSMDKYLEQLSFYTDLMVEPSGDIDGNTDRERIQKKLDECNCVILSGGDYYINAPLTLKSGACIMGKGTVNTRIICFESFCSIAPGESADNLIISDIKVLQDEVTVTENTAFELNGTTKAPFTGPRYSRFTRVHVEGFKKGVTLKGAWCVSFEECRFDITGTGVSHSGTCNNITYKGCQFLGVDKTQLGIDIAATGGAENYTVSVEDCDFERLNTGVKAYCCINLFAYNNHCESVTKPFALDSCVNFVCEGLYSVDGSKAVSLTKSNALDLYTPCYGVLKNVFMKLERDADHILCDVAEGCTLEHENINVKNSGSGRIYINGSDLGSRATNRSNHAKITVVTDEVNVRYTSNTVYAPSILKRPKQQVKLTAGKLIATKAFTLASDITVYVKNGNGNCYVFYIKSGTYSVGSEVTGTQYDTTAALIDANSENYYVVSAAGASVDIPVKAKLTFLVGEMVI